MLMLIDILLMLMLMLMNMVQVALGNRGRKEIKFVAPAEEKPTTQTFSGPEVRIIKMQ